MKLRIRGNSVRLRLTRPEVAALAAEGEVSEHTAFGGGSRFSYALRSDPRATRVHAAFAEGSVSVTLPSRMAAEWAASEQVGIEAGQPADEGETLRILVEKDFACLAERPGEDDSDAYPHPDAD